MSDQPRHYPKRIALRDRTREGCGKAPAARIVRAWGRDHIVCWGCSHLAFYLFAPGPPAQESK